MKDVIFKFIAVSIVFFLTSSTHGQIRKGKWLAGIGFSYGITNFTSAQTNRDQKTSSGDIGLSMGKFLTKSYLLKIGYAYSNDKSNSIYSQDNYYKSNANTNGVSLGLSYFANVEGNFYYSPGFLINYDKSVSKFWSKQPGFQEVSSRNNSTVTSAAVYPVQFSYLLKNKLLMQAGFGEIKYAYINTTTDIQANNDAVGKSHGFNVSFFPSVSNIALSLIF